MKEQTAKAEAVLFFRQKSRHHRLQKVVGEPEKDRADLDKTSAATNGDASKNKPQQM